MFRRGDSRDIDTILNEIMDRLNSLEEGTVRRVLPTGYQWSENDSGQLIIEKLADNSSTVIL